MDFTVFSLTISILWVTVFTLIISLLRKQMFIMEYFSIYPLLILLAFNILRICFPLELPFTIVIESSKILPPIQSFFCEPFIHFDDIHINLAFIIVLLWAIGAAVIFFKHLQRYHRFRHLLDVLPVAEDTHLYDIFAKANVTNRLRSIKIIVHDSVQSPAITGFMKPVIILPNIKFNDEELYGIFMHESAHYKLCHHWIKLITEVICICFWWNPLFKELLSEVEHALELHSDKTVCAKLNNGQQRKYLMGIIKVAENLHYPKVVSSCSCSLVAEKDGEKLQQRFKMILEGYYHKKRKMNFITIPVLLSVFLLSYAFIFQPYSEPTEEDYLEDGSGGTAIENYSEWYLIESEQGYDLYERPNKFLGHVTYMYDDDEILNNLKIYKNAKEAEGE